jgi:hypothetical protein
MELTTGVLVRNLSTDTVVIAILNLNPDQSSQVTVQAFDWGTSMHGVALPIQVCPDNTVTVAPLSYVELTASIQNTFMRYEIRVSHLADSHTVTTVFSQHSPITAQEGNAVVQHELIPL